MSHVLLSLCNVQLERAPMIALLDPQTSDIQTLRLPEALTSSQGVTGLALSESFLFVAVPIVEGAGSSAAPEHSSLFVFDRHDLTLRNRYLFEHGIDVHSLWVEGDDLWAVSTGTDELLRLALDGAEVRSESVAWRPDETAPRADVNHLNTVARVGEELLVSGFGPRTGKRLSTANEGFVVSVEDGRRLASGIDQPHSIAQLAGELVVCESRRMSVRSLDGERSLRLSGYTRGLCLAGESLLVGVSRGRRGSQGDGVTENPGDPGEIAGSCSVVRLRPDSLEVEAVIDTAWLGMEIYDLMPVEGVSRWPVRDPRDSDRELLSELWNGFDATSRRMKQALQLSAERRRLMDEARQAYAEEREKTRSAAREIAAERTLARSRRQKAARIAAELAQLSRSPAPAERSEVLGADEAAAKARAAPPLVIVGIGGSGTRVFAHLAVAGGCFMGTEVNRANDALEFYELADRWCEPVHRAWAAGADPPDPDGFSAELERCVERHLKSAADSAAWGWKQPRSLHLLPVLEAALPGMRLLHVLRDGRDVAFGKTIHLELTGHYSVPPDLRDRPPALQMAALWSSANERAAEFGERYLEGRYMRVRLEDLCRDPAEVGTAVATYAGHPPEGDVAPLVKPPSSIGRWREADPGLLAEVTRISGAALERFGYLPGGTTGERTDPEQPALRADHR